ncbi:glycosyltransferase [Mariniluteicoccus flavus]
MRILYYAHHHGTGHLTHARRLAGLGVAEVVIVGAAGSDLELPPDVDPTHPHVQPSGSPFHWTPETDAVRARFDAFHRALDDVRPDAVLVDVSVEAAVFAHLAGHRVAHRRMPGVRDDAAHDLAYATSRRLFAYYPQAVEEPGFAYADRTRWLGMPADREALPASLVEPGTVVVVSGAGGAGAPLGELARAAASTPERTWHVLGPVAGRAPGPRPRDAGPPPNLHLHGWVDDPSPWLARAEVVVCGAGHNTIAAVAAARRAAVLVPEPRPHDEQLVFARRLHTEFGTPLVERWSEADWPSLLDDAEDPEVLTEGLLVDRATFAERVGGFLADLTG